MKNTTCLLFFWMLLLGICRAEMPDSSAVGLDRSRQIADMSLLITELNAALSGTDLDREAASIRLVQYIAKLDDPAILLCLAMSLERIEGRIGDDELKKAKILERGWISIANKLAALATSGDSGAIPAIKLLYFMSDEGRAAILVELAYRLKLNLK